MKGLKRILAIALASVLLAGIGTTVWLFSELQTPYYGAPTKEVSLEIPSRASTSRIADLLVQTGVLRRRLPFIVYIRYKDLERQIKAGEYSFSKAATPGEIARRLVRGDVTFRSVTIPEGLTAGDTIELLAKNGLGNPGNLRQLLSKTDLIRDIDPKARNLEGYLFPETYRFGSRVDSETVLKNMVQQFRVRIARLTAVHPLPAGWTMPRIVTLASMIEKEAKKKDEGPLIASVLINRLEKGMPLGCDATIIYAKKLAGTYNGNLSKADMRMETPYNSYLHPDLPPGPIANPGEDSLRAALNPARTDFLYYVSRNDGTHQFSKDFASHNRAVDRFQRSAAGRRSAGKR